MDEIRKMFVELQRQIEVLAKGLIIKKITIPSDTTGYLIPKVLASDPASPVNNEVWINSTSNQLKWNKNGAVKAVTLS
jgi:hypothetical protein